jgi:DNA-binding transcriptional regulator YiaG
VAKAHAADGPPPTRKEREGMRRVALVKELRWKLAMSQENFARAYGIPLETLIAYEPQLAKLTLA